MTRTRGFDDQPNHGLGLRRVDGLAPGRLGDGGACWLRHRALGGRQPARGSTTWTALNGQPLIELSADNPTQQLIDQQLAKSGGGR